MRLIIGESDLEILIPCVENFEIKSYFLFVL
jgi:hypothetical protein